MKMKTGEILHLLLELNLVEAKINLVVIMLYPFRRQTDIPVCNSIYTCVFLICFTKMLAAKNIYIGIYNKGTTTIISWFSSKTNQTNK